LQNNDYLKIAGNIHLSYYVEAADILGIEYEIEIYRMIARFHKDNKSWRIINTVTPLNSTPSCTIAKRKNLANLFLKNAGIPVPIQEKLADENNAVNFFNQYKDIVIKPTQAIGGHGVSILPKGEEAVRKAFHYAYKSSSTRESTKVIGEQFIRGLNYRLLVLGDKVIGAVRRIPPFVIGDGEKTILQLATEKSLQRERDGYKEILLDEETDKMLSTYGYNLNSIPQRDQQIHLRFNSNLTTGGTTQECLGEIHPYYIEMAINSAKALDLVFAGIDLITPDITKQTDCAINEVNYNPGLRLHYLPEIGQPVKVAVPIMEYISKFL